MKKGFIIVAIVLISLGIILSGVALVASEFNLKAFGFEKPISKEINVDEPFRNISIETKTEDIELKPADNAMCRIVYEGSEKRGIKVEVEDNTLKIKNVDDRNWFERLTMWAPKSSVIVYLPTSIFESVAIVSTTGDINIANIDAENMALTTSTGDIRLSSVRLSKDLAVTVTTGDLSVSDMTCRNLNSDGSTGSISLGSVTALERIDLKRSTGDVHFDKCDAADIKVKTSTGDVTGSLLSDKIFVAKSSTGRVSVPDSASGGKCELTTSTGDIKLQVIS
jgi:DUF4097 and DUF4098 domain-containing protein YvlB